MSLPRIGVAGLVFPRHYRRYIDTSHVLLIQRGSAPALGMWSLPGGRLDAGERLGACAQREVLEETGVVMTLSDSLLPAIGAHDVLDVAPHDGALRYHYVVAHVLGFWDVPEAASDAAALAAAAADAAAPSSLPPPLLPLQLPPPQPGDDAAAAAWVSTRGILRPALGGVDGRMRLRPPPRLAGSPESLAALLAAGAAIAELPNVLRVAELWLDEKLA